ncbi:MAG: hypothetical protein M3310_07905, partial [Actinomycetota bacterium]|nr:hypothetical protein [Actinomycetota bacterium]
AAKLLVAAAAGVALAVLALGVAFLIGEVWVGELGVGSDELQVAGRIIVAGALWAIVGIGLGGVLRSQVGAIVAAFVWFLIAEPLVTAQLESVGEYFPGNAMERFVGMEQLRSTQGLADEPELGLGAATVLVGFYAAAAAAVGTAVVRSRDVA